MKEEYQFELTLSKQDRTPVLLENGDPVGPIPVQVDFDPAREWALFRAVCAGDNGQARVNGPTPVWDEVRGAPHIQAFSVSAGANGSSDCVEFPITYFAAVARVLSAYFVQRGHLLGGELFNYSVLATPLAPEPDAPRPGGLSVRRKAPALDLRMDLVLDEIMESARREGDAPLEDEMPVFVTQAVLDEVARLTRAAGSMEVGEFLLGHLHRCPVSDRVFLLITDQVPAEHTKQDLVKLSFTAETFDAARAAVRERGRDELLAGWAHSHSWMHDTCKTCKKREEEGGCNLKADFFSADDVYVHRTAFLKAFSVALVASNSPCSGLNWAMFGWEMGEVRRRGFYVISGRGSQNDFGQND